MCIAVPCKIVSIEGDKATVEAAGARREAGLSLIEDAKIGDYVIVHAGYAIHKIDETTARETLKALKEVFDYQHDEGTTKHSENK